MVQGAAALGQAFEHARAPRFLVKETLEALAKRSCFRGLDPEICSARRDLLSKWCWTVVDSSESPLPRLLAAGTPFSHPPPPRSPGGWTRSANMLLWC